MKKLLPAVAAFLALLWCRVALAAAATPAPYFLDDYQDPALGRAVPLWQTVLTFGFKLLFVLGLVALTLWFVRRYWSRNNLLGEPTGQRIRVLESAPLVGSQTLHLVSVRGKTLLLASNGQGMVERLLELPEEEVSFTELVDLAEQVKAGEYEASLSSVVIPGTE